MRGGPPQSPGRRMAPPRGQRVTFAVGLMPRLPPGLTRHMDREHIRVERGRGFRAVTGTLFNPTTLVSRQ